MINYRKKLSLIKIEFINWFLPIFMILAQYSIGGFSNYGFVIISISAVVLILFSNRSLYFHKYLLIFTIYVSIIAIINMFRLGIYSHQMINRIIMSFVLNIVIAVFISRLDLNKVYKSYMLIGLIAMAIMFIQSVRLFIFDIPAVPIRILPVPSESAHYWNFFSGERPSSLFTEPQAYASFMLPLLVMTLEKNNLFLSIMISFSIFLSTSGQGIIMVGIIYFYTLVSKRWGISKKMLLLFLIVILFILFLNLDIFDYAVNRISNIEIENNIRLTRGFLIYSKLDFMEKLLGINDNIKSFLINETQFHWVANFIGTEREHLLNYATSVSGVLLEFGLFAGVLLLLMFYRMYRFDDKKMRIYLLLIVILSFTQTLLFNGWFVLYYMIYLGGCNKKMYSSNYLKVTTEI